jgi:hypothetical protein
MPVFHPGRYHGHRRRQPFFEGRYYKLVDAAEQHRYTRAFEGADRYTGLKVAGQLEQLLA